MLTHGLGKVAKFALLSQHFPDPLGLGSFLSLSLAISAEVGAACLIVLGFLTRLATLPLGFTMFVAGILVHGVDPLSKKELALLYLFIYLSLALTGPGQFSLDQLFFGKKAPSASSEEAE